MERLRQCDRIYPNPEAVREVVRSVFSQSEVMSIELLSEDWANANWEIKLDNPEVSLNLRLFLGKDAEGRAEKEEYFYNLVNSKTDVSVPEVYLRDESKQLINAVFILESKLPGIKFEKYGDRFEDKQIGQFLSWKEYFLQFIRENLAWCSEREVIPREVNDLLGSYIEKWSWILDTDSPPCLAHQDFHLENVNVLPTSGGGWTISGIYDFEHGISGHYEWAFAKPRWAIFGPYPTMKRPMLEGYLKRGSLSDKFEERLNFDKVAESINFWVFGTKVGFSSEINRSIKETVQNIKKQL